MAATSVPSASFQLILKTTEQLIIEKGCRSTTLQDIIVRSGLSKGAIYHYVSGKDELFGLVLKARMEEINTKFFETVSAQKEAGIDLPLQTIVESMVRNTGPQDVANQIFIYLLSQMDQPKVAELVRGIYRHSLDTSRKWIEVGQASGVIPQQVDADNMALTFVTFMYGMRVQNMLDPDRGITPPDIFRLMSRSFQ